MLEDNHSKECGNYIAKNSQNSLIKSAISLEPSFYLKRTYQIVKFKMEICDDNTAVEGIKEKRRPAMH